MKGAWHLFLAISQQEQALDVTRMRSNGHSKSEPVRPWRLLMALA